MNGAHPGRGLLAAVLVLLAGVAVAFTVGRFPIAPADVLAVLWSRLTGAPSGLPASVETVVLSVRAPRVAAAVLTGSALAAAGTAFQGLFRNPLVSPDILGASSGAALGAVVGIYFSLGVFGIQALAFAGGLAAVAAVYVLGASLRAGDTTLALVLTGVVVGALLGAGVGLVKYLADPYNQLPAMTFWLLGSLSGDRPRPICCRCSDRCSPARWRCWCCAGASTSCRCPTRRRARWAWRPVRCAWRLSRRQRSSRPPASPPPG